MPTKFDSKALILGQVWIEHKSDDEMADFFAYNDIGIPLAFAYAEGIVNFRSSMWLNLLCLLIVCLIEGSQSCSKFYLMFVNGQVSSWLSYLLWLQVS